MTDLREEYLALKDKIKDLEMEKVRNQTQRDNLLHDLEEDFDCDSLEEAIELQRRLKKKVESSQKKALTLLKQFKEKYKDRLDFDVD